jgi:hypothetical protein
LTWLDEKRPLLETDIPGIGKERFLIDTGCRTITAGMLREEVCEQLTDLGRMKPISTPKSSGKLWSLGGTISTRSGKIDRFNLGPFSHERLIFSHRAEDGPDDVLLRLVYGDKNVLGLGYLSRYVVTFDFARSAMYLKPGREYTRQDRHDLAGIRIARVEGKTVVTNVDEGAPAGVAGMKEADEILEIDGVPVAKVSVFEVDRMFATPGERKLRYVRKLNEAVEHHVVTFVLAEPDEEAAFGAEPQN